MLDAWWDMQHLICSQNHVSVGQAELPGAFQHDDDFFIVVAVRLSDRPLHDLDSGYGDVLAARRFSGVQHRNLFRAHFVPVVETHNFPLLFDETTSPIPPTAVGGSFKSSLQTKAARLLPQIPPTAVGGLFKSSLQEPKWTASPIQLTAVGGIRTRTREGPFCRPDLNNPPTAVGGLRTTTRAGL